MSEPGHRHPHRRPRCWAGVFALLAAIGTAAASAQPPASRVRPPPGNACPPDQLTMYGGRVLSYRRGADRTELRIRTDWDTTEAVAIRHPGGDPSRWFLIERRPFTAADWPRIEAAPGRLLGGMRAAAWVCDDGRNPLVDWQPPRAP